MYDERFDEPAPTPWLRRPAVRAVIAAVAAGSFLFATLVASCGPRPTTPPATTTTTVATVHAYGNLSDLAYRPNGDA